MKKIVIKISGSIFYWNRVEHDLPPLVDVVKSKSDEGIKFVIVAGGGEVSRKYIDVGRKFGANEGLLDELGLRAAQLNAGLILALLRDMAYDGIPPTLQDCIRATYDAKVVVVGGLHPGHSTNAVGALIAERLGADLFINATDVDGVYSKDPRRFVHAKRLEYVTTTTLRELVGRRGKMVAGSYELMDLLAINIIERAKINTKIIKCTPDNLMAAIEGKKVGTTVIFNE